MNRQQARTDRENSSYPSLWAILGHALNTAYMRHATNQLSLALKNVRPEEKTNMLRPIGRPESDYLYRKASSIGKLTIRMGQAKDVNNIVAWHSMAA